MKLPRDVSGEELIRGLKRVGYEVTRRGGHVCLTTKRNGEHHVVVPMHNPVKVGTLAAILAAVAMHLRMERSQLLRDMGL